MFLSYLGLEIASVAINLGINIKVSFNTVNTLGDNGYKFISLEDNKTSNQEKISKFKKIINTVIFFIPGVNLISPIASLVKSNNINYLKKEGKDLIEEMTTEEKEAYSKLNKTSEKMLFFSALVSKDDERRDRMLTAATIDKERTVDELQARVDSVNKVFDDNEDENYDTIIVNKDFMIDVPKERTEENEQYFQNLEFFREKYRKLDELLAKKEERESSVNKQSEKQKVKTK